jgi:hypothetical protein
VSFTCMVWTFAARAFVLVSWFFCCGLSIANSASLLGACTCWSVSGGLLLVSCCELVLACASVPSGMRGTAGGSANGGSVLVMPGFFCLSGDNGGKLAADRFSPVSEGVSVFAVPIGVTCAGFSCICSSGGKSWVFCTCVDLSRSGVSDVAGARLDPAEGVLVSAMWLSASSSVLADAGSPRSLLDCLLDMLVLVNSTVSSCRWSPWVASVVVSNPVSSFKCHCHAVCTS